ncbi:hypothetical protein ACLBVR_36285, partial [Pseudomonas aeruginosa]
ALLADGDEVRRRNQRSLELVEEKAAKGQLHAVEEEEEVAGKGADIIDLTDLLKRSLRSRAGGGKDKDKGSEKAGADAKGRAKSGASRSRRKA